MIQQLDVRSVREPIPFVRPILLRFFLVDCINRSGLFQRLFDRFDMLFNFAFALLARLTGLVRKRRKFS